MAVELYRWVPTRPLIDLPRLRRLSPRVKSKNFGDEIGPLVVNGILRKLNLTNCADNPHTERLLSVGSVFHFARDGDHIWGSGINGKERDPVVVRPGELTIHAVRGPRTRAALISRGFEVPEIFGDPALLLPEVDQRFAALSRRPRRRLVVVPNLNDVPRYRKHPDFVTPLQSPLRVAKRIVEAELVVGSSLHALVLSDLYGVPCRRIVSSIETDFKYVDYYEGTGRSSAKAARDVDEAIALGGSEPMTMSTNELLDAFPAFLFR